MSTYFSIKGISPDSISCFRFVKKCGNLKLYELSETATDVQIGGLTIQTTTGQINLRKIINENLGKRCNPWCYIQNMNSNHWNINNLSLDALIWWKIYSVEPKIVAFKGNIPYGFRAVSIINKNIFMNTHGYSEYEYIQHLEEFYNENPPWQDRFNNYFVELDANGKFK